MATEIQVLDLMQVKGPFARPTNLQLPHRVVRAHPALVLRKVLLPPVHNASIAETLRHVADLLEIEGANPFRIRAYRRAAQTVEDLPQSAAKMVAEGKTLVGLPGIGKDLAGKITEIVNSGRLGALAEIEARTPTTLSALTTVPGLGPKRVHRLHEALGIKTVKDLERAAKTHKIRELRGFTAKTEEKILSEIEQGKAVTASTTNILPASSRLRVPW